ncbi:MAG: T9SS type A sorting domain-containing protein [Bacteroidales bacterium]|nr:T9SS type A sorting domain-containing protein [Bacteroidales bacterium]
MKHASFVLILLIAFPLFAIGQDFTITASDSNHISLHFELGDFSIDTIRHEGELMHTIAAKGIVMPNDYGQPDLPTFNRFVAIPQGAKAVVEVKTRRDEVLSNINIAPSDGSQCENDAERPFFKDPKVYANNNFYPTETYCVAEPQQLRGVDVIHLGISPFQINPVTRELAIHRELDIDIRFEGGNGHFGDDRLRSRFWDPILRNNILNYECLEPIDYDARMQQWTQNRATGCEYLIMTPDNDAYYEAGKQLADFRNKQGILTQVMRVTEIENPTGQLAQYIIRQWIRDVYDNCDIPPAAVCIIGESGTNLQQYVPGYTTLHPKDNFITSDNPYADVNDDRLPDICFSRILAQNESELPIFIGKILEYEYTNTVSDLYYYTHPLTAAAWQDSKWFQITIATISGYLSQHGKYPVRINELYDGQQGSNWSTAPGTASVVEYFGPEGVGYIPATPGELGGWTGGNAEQVIDAINHGAYIIQHRDHGWNAKWYQPEIYTSDFGDINNVNKLTYLISVNCRTGMYDNATTCFIEALSRMTRDGQNAGIVGAIGPTGQTYSYANDIFLWGVWDLFDPTFLPEYGPFNAHSDSWMPAFACVSGKYFLETHVFPSTDQNMCHTTYNTFHTFGDAFIRLFNNVPQPITTTHDESIQCFSPFHITAPEGSQIALTARLGQQWHIVATATGTGEEQTITILENVPVSNIHLTITGENLLRVEEDIPLVPFDRPFVVVDSIAMNGSGLTLHYNQSVATNINVTNVGLQDCDGGSVSFTCDHEQLAITQGEASFDALPSNASQLIENAFQFTLSDSIYDRTRIPFTLTTQFGDETYAQEYEIEVVAPNIYAELIDVDDSQGNNNGRLDPGEFAALTFRVTNNGHYRADSPRISLGNNEGYIRVITPETPIEDLEVNGLAMVTFDVFVEFVAGEVPYVHLMLLSAINGLRIEQDVICPIGFVTESFENGMFDPIYWTNDPLHPWTIYTLDAYDGVYCANSGAIDHDESSELTLSFNSTESGEISFYRKVSSEANYDFLVFYIDGEEQDRWSGEVWWAKRSYPTLPGQHQYTWTYLKDYSVDSGSDCAWIDYIVVPPYLDGTDEQTGLPLNIHPNPTTDQVTLDLEQMDDFAVQVYDANGRLVFAKRNAAVVSFKDRPAGMYHIVVEQNGQRWSCKLIKM